MAMPPLSRELAEDAVARVEAALREGYRPQGLTGAGRGAVAEAATRAISQGAVSSISAFHSRLRTAETLYGLEPDWSLYRPARYQQPVPRVVIENGPLPTPALARPDGSAQRVLAIGDAHQDPRHPERLECLTWIARYASEQRFDRVIQIGDWSSWDSVNQHDRNETLGARLKPSIRADMDNLKDSLQEWRAGIDPDYKPRQTVVYGNHENRLERFENANPESAGTFTLARDELFAQFGWRTRPYGEVLYVEGVGFTHHPINGAGRAFGGETGPQRAANKTTVPIVSGHTHRRQVHDAAKIGPVESISMVEIGCAMPWGTIESYAKMSATGWWWGVVDMTCHGGVITDINFVSMLTLQRRYGRKAAA